MELIKEILNSALFEILVYKKRISTHLKITKTL